VRKHNYLIGYAGEGQVVYGTDKEGEACHLDLMTLFQAKREKKKFPDKKRIRIYKLVELPH